VVILDNGRSAMLGGPIHDMLRCIRCGACMNHCPVYGSVGGHAYGWVYPGPMGSVLTPQFLGIEQAGELANASTLCGRCQSVCPVRIPLPDLLRRMREREHEQKAGPGAYRRGLALWRFFAARPRLYHAATGIGIRLLALLAGKRKRFAYLPFAGGWTRHRDLPAPEGKTFHQLWKQRKGPGA
jgi:L-lactate dehydrogenase complex protein LldF